MASTSSHFYRDPQTVLDDIELQFSLDPQALTDLVKTFLEEYRVGLSNYGHPMAMMCVKYCSFNID